MRVELISCTPDADILVAKAAHVCYSELPAWEVNRVEDRDKQLKLIEKLKQSGHDSPFEHITFTFAVDGLSRVASHQLVRHRMASFSQKSQRYTDSSNAKLVIPPSVLDNPVAATIFESVERELLNKYDVLVKEGIPKEDARYILPHGLETSIVFTMNARALFNFFKLRLCYRAQEEIRALAYRMLIECMKAAPHVFKDSGPSCVTGNCTELSPCKEGGYHGSFNNLLLKAERNQFFR